MSTPEERIAAGQELRRRGKLSPQQDAALAELEKRYTAPASASGKRGGMVTEGTISREEYMRQRGPVNEAAPSAADGSLIPAANQPVQTPFMKPVVSEDMLRPGPFGVNTAATLQALETPQALRSEKMTMAQSAALGIQDLSPLRGVSETLIEGAQGQPEGTQRRAFESSMTRSLEDNPITTRVGQTAALTAGGGAQLTNRALVYAPKLVAPAVAARFAGSRAAQYLGRGAVLAGTGVADFYGYNALAEAPNQARMTGAPSPTMGQRIDYANSQVFTPAGLISAGLPVAGSVIARGVRGVAAGTKNLATTGSATTRTLPGGGTAQVPVSNLFTPASVQRSVAAGQAINAQSKSARGRTAREEAIDLLIAKGISADETEKLVKLISYDNYTTVDEMLFELANADIDQLAVAAARVGGDAKKTFREAFKARNAEMPERIRTQLRDAMALSGDELEDFAAQMAARADEATADGYTAAYSQQISDTTWGKMWDRLSVSPDAREAIAAGARLARNSYRGNPAQLDVARQLEQLASALDSPSAIPPKLSTHALDYLDRGFGSLIAGQKKNNPAFASSLIEIQKALRDAGLDADTGLAGPRQVYSQFKAAGRALEFGAKAFGRGTSLKDLKKQFAASLKDADEVFEDIVGEGRSVVDQALIMGWLRGAEDAIETATNPGALLRQIYGSERQRAKLLEMMPSETDAMTSGVKGDQTKRIKALVGSELGKEDYTFNFGLGSGARAEGRRAVPSLFERQRTMLENQGRVSGNSVTGDVTEAIANQGGLQRAAGLIAQSVMNPQQAAQNAALWAVQRATLPAIFKPEVNRELGRILTTRGREQILEIVAEIRARQAATGKGSKPPAASGTPPRGTPPSGSPTPSPNALAPQGPGGKSKLGTRTADAAAIAALSIAPPAQADTGGGAELEAANARVETATKRVEDVDKSIAQLEADMRLLENPKGDPKEIQRLLKRRGFNLGPRGVDGVIGPDTDAAITDNIAKIEAEIARKSSDREKAAAEVEKARKGVKDANMRAALKAAEPNAAVDMATKAAQGAAFLAATYGAYRLRGRAVKAYEPVAKAAARRANSLVNPGKLTAAKTGPNALNTRAANINEFWKQGGAGKNVPFQVDAQGAWSARPGAKEPSKLFKAPRYLPGDVKFMAGAGVEAGGTKYAADKFAQESDKAEADMEKALKAGDDVAFNAALQRKKSADGAEAFLRVLERLGYGAMAGRALSGLVRYPAVKANVNAADSERALLLQAMTKQKTAANKGQGQGNP